MTSGISVNFADDEEEPKTPHAVFGFGGRIFRYSIHRVTTLFLHEAPKEKYAFSLKIKLLSSMFRCSQAFKLDETTKDTLECCLGTADAKRGLYNPDLLVLWLDQ